VRSHYTLLGLLVANTMMAGCQGSVAEDVDLSCASMAADKEAMASCATSIIEQMSVEQKVAQLIQGEIRGLTAADVKKYGLGSVLNGGGAFPGGDKYATPQDWVDLADAY
jgi:beta-glucosidase